MVVSSATVYKVHYMFLLLTLLLPLLLLHLLLPLLLLLLLLLILFLGQCQETRLHLRRCML